LPLTNPLSQSVFGSFEARFFALQKPPVLTGG